MRRIGWTVRKECPAVWITQSGQVDIRDQSPAEIEKCEWHLQKSMALGILKPHVGAWATPAFVVKQSGKPHGRLVCDYRRVNARTLRAIYHVRNADWIIRSIADPPGAACSMLARDSIKY